MADIGSPKDSPPTTTSSVTLTLEGSPERARLSSLLNDVWQTGRLSDIILSARGKTFKVHKLALASQINYPQINKYLELDTVKEVVEVDLDPDIFRVVLEYVYTNKAVVGQGSLGAVADMAQLVGVRDLWLACKQAHLTSTPLTTDNCLTSWVVAQQIGNEDYISQASAIAVQNFVQLKRTADFKSLPFSILKDYVSRSDLEARTPEERLAAAMVWMRAEAKDRMKHLCAVLDSLPLNTMNDWYLEQLLDDPLIQSQPDACQRLSQIRAGLCEEQSLAAEAEDLCQSAGRPDKERALVAVGGHAPNEVWAVCLHSDYEVSLLGKLGADVRKDRPPKCCVLKDKLYVCGLGDLCQEAWYFNLHDHHSEKLGR